MRDLLALAVAVTLVLSGFAGCIDNIETASNDTATNPQAQGPENRSADLPDPINAEETVTGSAEPLAPADQPCTSPSATCHEYPFTLATQAAFDAQLTWELENSDFDLYLATGDTQNNGNVAVQISGSEFIGTSEAISTTLDPGDYTILVQASNVAQDTYTLEAVFAHA